MIKSTLMPEKRAAQLKWRLWPRWVVATAMPGSLTCLIGYGVNANVESGGLPGLLLLGATLSLIWAIIGLAQWSVLRPIIPSVRSWVFASVIGGVMGTVLGWWISTGWYGVFTSTRQPALLAIGVTGAIGGVVLGLAQWRILQDRLSTGRGWILASAASGVAGWIVAWSMSDTAGFLTASAFGWAAGAAISGLALVLFLKE